MMGAVDCGETMRGARTVAQRVNALRLNNIVMRDIEPQGPTQADIQDLQPAANRQHRQALFQRGLECRKLPRVTLWVRVDNQCGLDLWLA